MISTSWLKRVWLDLAWFAKYKAPNRGTWKLKATYDLDYFLSTKTALKSELWAIFEHVVHISHSRSLNNFCSL
jgi:hypothetical protein